MITEHIDTILIVTGILTAGMVIQFFLPKFIVKNNFGEELSGNAALLIARHWGLLVFCFGVLLIWSAHHPEIRIPVIYAAIVEKSILALCIFLSPFRSKPIPLIIAGGDTLMAVVYLAYLFGH